jgi:Ca2+-binding EF-hand superfamily protein
MLRFTPSSLLALCVATAVFVPLASASPLLEKADLNKNGRVEQTEFTTFANQRFSQIDVDGDGLLTDAERTEFHKVKRAERVHERFEKVDSNHDAAISEEELSIFREQRSETRRAQRKERREARQEHRQEHRQKMRARAHGADSNQDGVIARDEHDQAVLRRFERMDSDGNGYLDGADEITPRHQQRHKRHGSDQ